MSKSNTPAQLSENLFIETEEDLRQQIEETFQPHTKSRQAVGGNLSHHIDGQDIHKSHKMKPLWKVLRRQEENNHPMATHPRAFVDPIVHLRDHDAHALEKILDGGADIEETLKQYPGQFPETRRKMMAWLAEDPDRLAKMNKGGTDVFIHGMPGTTKTTLLGYLAARVMEVNNETVAWAASPGRSEWLMLAPWATVAFPKDVAREVRFEPFNSRIEPFEVDITDFARDVIEYRDPEHLMEMMRDRPDGSLYVTYPDPRFRACEFLVGQSYTDVWEADDLHSTTPLSHWWFAWAIARVEGPYSYWTSLIGDEVDEWLDSDAANDEHGTYYKVKSFKDSFRDFRKDYLSFYLAAHSRSEVHQMVRKKLRWTCTMNQEKTPEDAPVDTDVTSRMDLGEGLIWKSVKSASFSWPNMKSRFSVPGRLVVEYTDYEAERRRKGGRDDPGAHESEGNDGGHNANA